MSGEHDETGALFQVDQHESLPEVLERLHGHRGESLTLQVADHSSILLTATEFRALKDLADRLHIRLSLQTRDSLRRQLASMFGLAKPTRQPEAVAPSAEGSVPNSGSWRNARRPQPRPADHPPDEELPERPADDEPDEDPISISRRRRNRLYADSAAHAEPEADFLPIDAGLDYIEEDEAGERHSRAWLYGRIAAASLVVVVLAFAAFWYWFPAVELDVALRQTNVSTDIVYSVAAPGADIPNDASFAVEANEQSATAPFRIEIPASGVERRPDGTASGPMLFRNAGDAPARLAQGTELTTADGTRYLVLKDVEVPGGSVDDPGEAEAPVTAAKAGAAGNREVGALTGKVPDADVYYSNLAGPVEGGSDRQIAVVTDEDVAAAQRAVQEDLGSAAADGWASQLPVGMAIVNPSVDPGDPDYTIEGAAGDQRESVVVTGIVPVTGLVYDLADVERQSRSTFEVALQDQLPRGYELDASTIKLEAPKLIAEAPENSDYRVSATAVARARFDDGARQGLRERMAGSSLGDAKAAVDSVGAIESWRMAHSPGWWPDRMPRSADRITLNIVDSSNGGGNMPASPAPSPVSTPEAGAGA